MSLGKNENKDENVLVMNRPESTTRMIQSNNESEIESTGTNRPFNPKPIDSKYSINAHGVESDTDGNETSDEHARLLRDIESQHDEQEELDNHPPTHKTFRNFIYSSDVLLSIVLFSPIVSIYWYGTWTYLDNYFLVDDPKTSSFVSWTSGLFILLIGYLFQQDFQHFYDYLHGLGKCGNFCQVLVRSVYIYLMSFAVVAEWRGLWNLFNFYFFSDWQSQFVSAIIALSYFLLSRATRSLITTPFVLFMDDYEHFFTTESRHKFRSVSFSVFPLFLIQMIHLFHLILLSSYRCTVKI